MKYSFAYDRIIPTDEARIHPMDLAVIRGYGIFDFFRVSNGKPLFLEHYLDRFINSAKDTYMELGLSRNELRGTILQLIEKNEMITGGFRMVLTGGVSSNHFSPEKGSLFIFAEELSLPAKEKYEHGIKLLSLEHVRAVAKIKMTNYAYPVWHSKIWKESGAEDVLYHQNGEISESSRSNFFIFKNGKLITPSKNILQGITRHHILELAENKEIRDLTMAEALDADEAFITSTTKIILPVVQIDDNKIGMGKPGPLTSALLEKFRNLETELVG